MKLQNQLVLMIFHHFFFPSAKIYKRSFRDSKQGDECFYCLFSSFPLNISWSIWFHHVSKKKQYDSIPQISNSEIVFSTAPWVTTDLAVEGYGVSVPSGAGSIDWKGLKDRRDKYAWARASPVERVPSWFQKSGWLDDVRCMIIFCFVTRIFIFF